MPTPVETDDKHGKTLSTTEAPAKPKARTVSIPESLKKVTRRSITADHAKKSEAKFDALDKAVDDSKEAAIARNEKRIAIKNFKPSDKNKKKDPADVVVEPEKKEETAAETIKSEPEKKDEPKGEKPNEQKETEVVAEKQPEKQETESGENKEQKASETLELAPEYLRSLKAFGITDDEIKEGMAGDAKSYIQSAKMIHAARKHEIEKFAEAGRSKTNVVAQQLPANPAASQPGFLKPINVAEWKKQYGIDDPGVDALIAQQNTMIEVHNSNLQRHQQQEMALLTKNIEAFFSKPELAAYADDYKNAETKDKTLQRATELILGAQASGRQVGLDEALTMAHDSLMAPKAKAAAKQELVDEAKKRAAAVSQKPSQAVAATTSSKPKTRAALYEKVGARLRLL